jgi:hypothetical protein
MLCSISRSATLTRKSTSCLLNSLTKRPALDTLTKRTSSTSLRIGRRRLLKTRWLVLHRRFKPAGMRIWIILYMIAKLPVYVWTYGICKARTLLEFEMRQIWGIQHASAANHAIRLSIRGCEFILYLHVYNGISIQQFLDKRLFECTWSSTTQMRLVTIKSEINTNNEPVTK